jgi:uncharacterized protein YabE (DUF348 family)
MSTILSSPTARRRVFSRAATDSLVLLLAMLMMIALWLFSAQSVHVIVDGLSDTVRTHRHTVAALVSDLGLTLQPNDLTFPPPQTRLAEGSLVSVERGRPLRVLADGRDLHVTSRTSTVGDALADADVLVDAYDQVFINGEPALQESALPPLRSIFAPITYDRGFIWDRLQVEPVQLRVRRAIPIVVDEGGLPYELRTTAPTVGEALRQAEVTIYLGDRVEPHLSTGVSAGLRVTIQRSTPVSVQLDGRVLKTRTRAASVGDALSEMGVLVAGLDRVSPALETPLYPDIAVSITRVREDVAVEEEIEPFDTVFEGDPNLAIDTQQLANEGAPGINRQRYRLRYEDGVEVSRTLEDEWLAQQPAQRVIAYGQRIDPQTATIDGQTITYWRKVRMLATSYNAASGGGNRTFTGDVVRPGVVAVDPRIVPLRSKVFVPGYGYGDALDTGGGIISRRIDLAYDPADYYDVLRWVDVYLLWPPPSSQITWVVPNYPRVPEN